jgi:hypothetical protein
MENEGSLPFSQQTVVGPEPRESNTPPPQLCFRTMHFNIIHPFTSMSSEWSLVSSLQAVQPNFLYVFFSIFNYVIYLHG